MKLLTRLEQKLRRFALPHLTLGLIAGQVMVYIAINATRGPGAQVEDLVAQDVREPIEQRLYLIPERVLAGEVWRLVTFLVVPPITNILFAFFFWYLFYLMGTALEHHWGDFRYNVFLLIGYLATVAVSFLTPDLPSFNGYLQASVFLAFAFLYPNFELYLFFVLPVKIKWLALLNWIFYFFTFALGDWHSRLLVAASICNFFVFFGRDVVDRIKHGRRRMATQAARLAVKERAYFHRCLACGITDRTHPTMDFRYCSKCAGSCGYCTEHLYNHEHVMADNATSNNQ